MRLEAGQILVFANDTWLLTAEIVDESAGDAFWVLYLTNGKSGWLTTSFLRRMVVEGHATRLTAEREGPSREIEGT